MASKERGGAVDNSTKSAKSGGAGKRITAPAYAGTQTSASAVVGASSGGVVSNGTTMAQQIFSSADSLGYATRTLAETLQALGLYEPQPAKAEDLAAAPHHNVLRVINEEVKDAIKFANNVLYEAVMGNDEEEVSDADEGAKEPSGPILKTSYGRNVYHDSQTLIQRLLSLQYLANRLNLSLVGVEGPADTRESQVTDSVHACLCNLADHIDDTVSTLHRVNADLTINLLGAIEK